MASRGACPSCGSAALVEDAHYAQQQLVCAACGCVLAEGLLTTTYTEEEHLRGAPRALAFGLALNSLCGPFGIGLSEAAQPRQRPGGRGGSARCGSAAPVLRQGWGCRGGTFASRSLPEQKPGRVVPCRQRCCAGSQAWNQGRAALRRLNLSRRSGAAPSWRCLQSSDGSRRSCSSLALNP